jgi:hypothetical protein
MAAVALPPRAMKSAMTDVTFANVRRERRVSIHPLAHNRPLFASARP